MDNHDERRAAAMARIADKRDFKNHALVYCAVNTLLVIIWAASGAGYFWPIWPIAGWGIAVALHAWRTYGQKPISEAEINEEIRRVEDPLHRASS
ncbi:MAG: 2TM domain-containing protein [Acidimicrobiia bacterium]|nr:2TM domain-containing protein [Acidimicrobiia bacterium]NNL98640.1 2TM domain-containing protein [Acidimicrobiia bacterium]